MKIQEKTLEVSYQSVVILRIMLNLIFVVAGSSHFFKTDETVNRMQKGSMGFIGNMFGSPEILVFASGAAMLIAGFALMLGFRTKIAALVLIAVLIPITLTVQVGQAATMGPLFKNVAILGGLIFFTLNSKFKIQKQ